jgi:hypothetical protein
MLCGRCQQLEKIAHGEPVNDLLPLHTRHCSKRGNESNEKEEMERVLPSEY